MPVGVANIHTSQALLPHAAEPDLSLYVPSMAALSPEGGPLLLTHTA